VRFGAVLGYLSLEVEQDQAWQIPCSLRLDHAAYFAPQDAWIWEYRQPCRCIDSGCLSIRRLITPPP
jgi:hypothetical protein